MFEPVVAGSWKHVVSGSQLLQITETLELGSVHDAQTQIVKHDVAMDGIIDNLVALTKHERRCCRQSMYQSKTEYKLHTGRPRTFRPVGRHRGLRKRHHGCDDGQPKAPPQNRPWFGAILSAKLDETMVQLFLHQIRWMLLLQPASDDVGGQTARRKAANKAIQQCHRAEAEATMETYSGLPAQHACGRELRHANT